MLRQPEQTCFDIIDVNWRDRLPYQATGHRNFDYHEHQVANGFDGITYVNTFHDEFMSSVGNPEGVVPSLDRHAGTVYGAETLEELAEIIGVPQDTFLATVARYNELVAKGHDGKPIAGLWAAGNCCGGKFGPSYFTPIPGMNHGNAVTHGYYVGQYAAE